MSRRIGVIAAIACVLVLCFALVGCGGGVDKSKFVGSWELISSDAEGMDANAIETMKSLVAKYWDSVTYPDPELEDQYYAMVTRLFF